MSTNAKGEENRDPEAETCDVHIQEILVNEKDRKVQKTDVAVDPLAETINEENQRSTEVVLEAETAEENQKSIGAEDPDRSLPKVVHAENLARKVCAINKPQTKMIHVDGRTTCTLRTQLLTSTRSAVTTNRTTTSCKAADWSAK